MTTYAFIMTWLVGFAMGVLALAAFFVYLDGRDQKKQQAAAAARHRRNSETPFAPETETSMEEAIELVQDKLGGKIIS